MAQSPVLINRPELICGKRVLVVEDGPTLTHGGMAFGAGYIAATQFQAAEVVDPRPYAVGTIEKAYQSYPQMGPVLPALGYNHDQINDLEATINNVPCDLVLFATPIQLSRILSINKPLLRVRYEYKDYGSPTLEECLKKRLQALADAGKGPDNR